MGLSHSPSLHMLSGCGGQRACWPVAEWGWPALQRGVLIAGDDFKSGQTKLKSVLVDFLVGAGLKPTSIVSYNHLGNNDGMNLSAPQTFRSKARLPWPAPPHQQVWQRGAALTPPMFTW